MIAEYGKAPAGAGGTSYYLADRLSTRMITDNNGAFKGTQDHLPFGEDAGTSGTSEKHRFTNYERDTESGTDYAINRQHSSSTGRFLRPDPFAGSTYLTNPQTLNRYTYGWADPVNKIDPFGLDSLLFDGCKVTRFDDKGKTVQSWDAVSGKPGTSAADQANKGNGPLPEGVYTIDPKESQNRFDKTVQVVPSGSYPYIQTITVPAHPLWAATGGGAWGNYRTVLHPDSKTDLRGRDANGFFVHGGDIPGSAGCIDLTAQNNAFHYFLKNYGKPITLTVKLTCDPWKRSSNQTGAGGGDGAFIGGFDSWWYSMWDFLDWLKSIPIGKPSETEDDDHLG